MTGDALAAAERRLAAAGVPTPRNDAELLVRHVTGWGRGELLLRRARPMPADAGDRLEPLVARRAAREPLQLILGSVGFRHLDLLVRPGVFLPRPETEVLAGEAADRTPAGGVVVEPCTGTGAIACAVASESAPGRVLATDVSAEAVALARENAARCGVAVEVGRGDLLGPVPRALRGHVDVLVCNPPYVAEAELAGLEPEVRDWDPGAALVSGPTGNEVVERLVDAAPRWLRPGGWLLLELDPARAAVTAARCRVAGLTDVGVVRDLAGRDRIVLARHGMTSSSAGAI